MDSNFGFRKAVRVNPHQLIGASDEEDEVISTVEREGSHDVFSSKHIRFFGPIGIGAGAIPLRELPIGVGDRTGHGVQQDGALPNPISTTYYCHYAGHPLDAKQFEVLWYFDKFVKGEVVADMDDKRTECIMTLWNRVRRPATTFNKRTRKYHYEHWTDLHFEAFFEEYCASKAAMAMMNPTSRDTASEWMKLRPPKPLIAAEWQAFVTEIDYSWLASSNEECSKIDKEFKELLGIDAMPGIEPRHEKTATEPSRPRSRAKSFRNLKGHRKTRNKKTKRDTPNCSGERLGLNEEQSTGKPRAKNGNSTYSYGHTRQNKRQRIKRRLSRRRQAQGRRGHKLPTISPTTSSYGGCEVGMYSVESQEVSDDSIDMII